eukprot:1192040-Amphidinium_carterae.1
MTWYQREYADVLPQLEGQKIKINWRRGQPTWYHFSRGKVKIGKKNLCHLKCSPGGMLCIVEPAGEGTYQEIYIKDGK